MSRPDVKRDADAFNPGCCQAAAAADGRPTGCPSPAGPLEVVEDKVGTGSVDFWGISFSPSSTEQGPMEEAELARGITILQACWAFFDGVAARVSPEMRKGPRGGGRDRDRIIRHTIRVESEDFAKQVGLRIPEEGALAPEALRRYREDYVAAMRA